MVGFDFVGMFQPWFGCLFGETYFREILSAIAAGHITQCVFPFFWAGVSST